MRIVVDFQRQQRVIVAGALGFETPAPGAQEAVARQFALGGNLRKADGNAATDRLAAVEDGFFGEKQAFAAIGRLPGKDLTAEAGDDGGAAVRTAQAPGFDAVKFDGFNGGFHGNSQ